MIDHELIDLVVRRQLEAFEHLETHWVQQQERVSLDEHAQGKIVADLHHIGV